MSRRNNPVVITTMGQRLQRPQRYPMGQRPQRYPRPRIGLGGAVAIGIGLLFVYALVSLIFHVIAATIFWLPAIIVAGYVSAYAGRKGVHGLPRLAIGIIVLIAVRAALLAL